MSLILTYSDPSQGILHIEHSEAIYHSHLLGVLWTVQLVQDHTGWLLIYKAQYRIKLLTPHLSAPPH